MVLESTSTGGRRNLLSPPVGIVVKRPGEDGRAWVTVPVGSSANFQLTAIPADDLPETANGETVLAGYTVSMEGAGDLMAGLRSAQIRRAQINARITFVSKRDPGSVFNDSEAFLPGLHVLCRVPGGFMPAVDQLTVVGDRVTVSGGINMGMMLPELGDAKQVYLTEGEADTDPVFTIHTERVPGAGEVDVELVALSLASDVLAVSIGAPGRVRRTFFNPGAVPVTLGDDETSVWIATSHGRLRFDFPAIDPGCEPDGVTACLGEDGQFELRVESDGQPGTIADTFGRGTVWFSLDANDTDSLDAQATLADGCDEFDTGLLFTRGAEGSAPGITEFFFESAEPSFEEQSLEELLALFPEGLYRFRCAEGAATHRTVVDDPPSSDLQTHQDPGVNDPDFREQNGDPVQIANAFGFELPNFSALANILSGCEQSGDVAVGSPDFSIPAAAGDFRGGGAAIVLDGLLAGEGTGSPFAPDQTPSLCDPADSLADSLSPELRSAQTDDDGVVVVTLEVAGAIPVAAADLRFTYAAVFDRDGEESNNFQALPAFPLDFFQNTDMWYEVLWVPTTGWTVQRRIWTGASALVTPTEALALIVDRVLVLAIPRNEFPASSTEVPFRVSAFVADPSDPFGLTQGLAIGDTAPFVLDERASLLLP